MTSVITLYFTEPAPSRPQHLEPGLHEAPRLGRGARTVQRRQPEFDELVVPPGEADAAVDVADVLADIVEVLAQKPIPPARIPDDIRGRDLDVGVRAFLLLLEYFALAGFTCAFSTSEPRASALEARPRS